MSQQTIFDSHFILFEVIGAFMEKSKLTDTIIINKAALKVSLNNYTNRLTAKKGWRWPLGLFLPLLVSLYTADFKPLFSMEADFMRGVISTFTIIAFVLLIYALIKVLFNLNAEDKFYKEISEANKNVPDFTAVYIIKRTKDNVLRLLVEKNKTWGCYFLPWTHYNPDSPIQNQSDELRVAVASFLGVHFDSVKIDHFIGYQLASEKVSEKEGMKKEFKIEFIYLYLSCGIYSDDAHEYTVGGRELTWMSLPELESDENTRIKNGDVISHLERHSRILINKPSDSIK